MIMAEKTRAELAAELDAANARIAELEAGAGSGLTGDRPRPLRPSFGMSEGTRLDILELQNQISRDPRLKSVELTEPFTGQVITITADDYTVATDEEDDQQPVDAPAVDGLA